MVPKVNSVAAAKLASAPVPRHNSQTVQLSWHTGFTRCDGMGIHSEILLLKLHRAAPDVM